jgi:quercetin dioxygenase-like cupin family protein
VLDGAMEANGQLLHAGSYAHFEAGTVHDHAPGEGQPCLFVIISTARSTSRQRGLTPPPGLSRSRAPRIKRLAQ